MVKYKHPLHPDAAEDRGIGSLPAAKAEPADGTGRGETALTRPALRDLDEFGDELPPEMARVLGHALAQSPTDVPRMQLARSLEEAGQHEGDEPGACELSEDLPRGRDAAEPLRGAERGCRG